MLIKEFSNFCSETFFFENGNPREMHLCTSLGLYLERREAGGHPEGISARVLSHEAEPWFRTHCV